MHHSPSPPRLLEPLDLETFDRLRDQQSGGPAAATVSRWFTALARLHHWTANRPEFYAEAARLVVDPIGLDGAFVLRRSACGWDIVAHHLPCPELRGVCELELIDRVAAAGVTLFEPAASDGPRVVIAPVLDAAGKVTGAIYGFRATHAGNGRRGVRYLEAHLVELLAQSVSTGINRLAREVDAARQRFVYEHAFTPVVAQQLELRGTPLAGEAREVTVLFADLRDFSILCDNLSTSSAYELLNEVMDALTMAVVERDGTLIDYYGDGLSAMWNAPVSQPLHPQLACQAALAMLDALPAVSDRWRHVLTAPLRLGIGLHTGPAQVGNIGSKQRMKYGPRGKAVNLAARVESATKLVGSPLLITRAVADRLPDALFCFRVCVARLPGVAAPVELFHVRSATTDQRLLAAIDRYGRALELYEAGEYDAASQLIDVDRQVSDLPTKFLAEHIEQDASRRPARRAGDVVKSHDGVAIELAVK